MSVRSAVMGGRAPLPPRQMPAYAYQAVPHARTLAPDASAAAAISLLWRLWLEGQYNELTRRLASVGDVLASKGESKFACEFLAHGGLDIYCLILCDPFNPLRFSLDRTTHRTSAADRGRWQRTLELIIGIYAEVMLQLTDLVADQNDLGWVIYDRYPGLFYRLIEFLEDSSLWSTATGLLEHTLACVGPVIEISKTPSLIKVLRGASPMAMAAFCRFLALLILPGLTQGQNPIVARRLHYPETVLVLRQVQRVVDSNVLWLVGERGLVSTLIGLCELRPNGLRVQQGGRSMMMLPPEPAILSGDAAARAAAFTPADPEDADWEDEEEGEEDGTWTDNDEGDGSGASGNSDGTADFLVDGSSLPTLFAGIERLLGLRQHQGGGGSSSVPRAPAPSATPTPPPSQLPAAGTAARARAQGTTSGSSTSAGAAAAAPATTSSGGSDISGGARIAALAENLELMHNAIRTGSVAALREVGRLGPTGDGSAGSSAAAIPGVDAITADMLAQLERMGLPREGAEQLNFLSRITSNQIEAEDPSRLVQWMMDRDMLADEDLDDTFKPAMDIHWWVGAADTRQRWRLRDPTLLPERDDNRHELVRAALRRTVAPPPRPPTREEFYQANGRLSDKLFEPLPEQTDTDPTDMQRIVESQSEVLYLLNMFLSTFYFSDSWQIMRECQWVPRSVAMLETAFGLDLTLPAFVDVPPHVNLPEKMRALPRFLPPPPTSEGRAAAVVALPGSAEPQYPATWRVQPLLELLGDSALMYLRDPNQIAPEEPDNHQHGPDTMRKMELLRCLYEYWNAQDRREQEMVVADAAVVTAARKNARAIARVISRDHEDSCVRVSLYQTLDSYLRTFLFQEPHRDGADSAQTMLGKALLQSLLERVYNGTRIAGLSGSMTPARLQSNMLQLLGELLRFHAGNLRILCEHVVGQHDLSYLNAASSNANRQNPVILSAEHEAVEAILQRPPLEREEHEPFGSVLLRRLYAIGVDAHLLLRALLLSLTPGLRSRGNYLAKPVPDSVEDVRLPAALPGIGRTSDIISGDAVRIAFVIRVSRRYARLVTLSPPTGPQRAALLRELVKELARTPHRQAPEQRPFPGLMCAADDLALLEAGSSLPPVGPPARLRAPLFSEGRASHGETRSAGAERSTGSDTDAFENDAVQLAELAPLARLLLSEPSKLIFAALCGLNIEAMEDNSRLSVVTTALLVFLRVAAMAGEAAETHIRAVLEAMRPYAQHGFESWVADERAARARERAARHADAVHTAPASPFFAGDAGVCTCDWRDAAKAEGGGGTVMQHSAEADDGADGKAAAVRGGAADEPRWRCPAFMGYGSCDPPHEGSVYQREFGGCFYRSFFRLLCLWVGYYASCQRYVETVYFSTEVAFGEFKTMALYLLRVLPDFFMPPFSALPGEA